MKIITDLDVFALSEIFRPFQNQIAEFGDRRLMQLPIDIDELPEFARKHPKWWDMVKNRLEKVGFTFPNYIKHSILEMFDHGTVIERLLDVE